MRQIQSVYVVEPVDNNWIIGRLLRDVASALRARGIAVRIGPSADYEGQEVIFNSRFLVAFSDPRALINSLFITHIDDKIKELQFKASAGAFNSFVCMSPQDAEYVAALVGREQWVVGINLPPREVSVRPIRLALFSARYEDGRKNEHWIREYFEDRPAAHRQAFVFCFIGWGWERFCASLAKLDMNFEILRYSRSTAGEYETCKSMLTTMDALIYLGFDGGAMSVYDGLNAGIPVFATNISYHRGLGDSVTLFDDRAGFFRELDQLYLQRVGRIASLDERNVNSYSSHLLAHWNQLLVDDLANFVGDAKLPVYSSRAQTLSMYRANYKRVGWSRIRSTLIRFAQTFFSRR